jgi:prepilin-type N-terminal cleavage/methylation domain-containing protein
MKMPSLGLIKRGQKGFTLIELAIAMAISGLIAGAVTMTMFQIVDTSGRTSNHMTVVRQVQSAGYWVSKDAQMAQVITTGAEEDDGFPLDLKWTEWGGNTYHITYTLEDMSGGVPKKELQRVEVKNEGSVDEETKNIIVAKFIDSSSTSCEYTDGKLTFKVKATLGDGSVVQTETRTYEIIPRPG